MPAAIARESGASSWATLPCEVKAHTCSMNFWYSRGLPSTSLKTKCCFMSGARPWILSSFETPVCAGFGVTVALKGNEIVHNKLEDIAGVPKLVPADHQMIVTAKNMGISFGD